MESIKNQSIKNSGYKYQVGWFTTDGNYYRIAVFKRKPTIQTINRLSSEYNIPLDRMQAGLIQ